MTYQEEYASAWEEPLVLLERYVLGSIHEWIMDWSEFWLISAHVHGREGISLNGNEEGCFASE
jgi:hypothetical protein